MIGKVIDTLSQKGKPDYQPDLFVNRDQEVSLVENKVEQGRLGISIREPLVNFWGVGGNGKTWLLHHIRNLYRYQSDLFSTSDRPTFTVYFDLEEIKADSTDQLASFIASYTAQLQKELIDQLPDETIVKKMNSMEVTPTAVAKMLVTLSEKYVPLLLFDTTERIPTDFWPQLEQVFFEPLLDSERILVILSGRHRAPRWRRVDVRRRAMAAAEGQIRPFDKQTQQEQLIKLGLGAKEAKIFVQAYFPFTGGNPYLAVQLAKAPNNRSGILQAYLNDVMAGIPKDLHFYLEKVAPLRFYRLEALRFMLEAASENDKRYQDVRLLQILRRFEAETEVVWWDNGRNAYITAPVVRNVMNQLMRLKDEAQFRRSHELALAMYWDLTERYPENSPIYLAEICYHQAVLDQLHQPPAKKLTNLGRIKLVAKKVEPDKRMILPKQIEADKELEDLLPEETYQYLLSQLQTLF